jgi:4-hydroxybenzoate polyprenyltransferase
VATLLDPRPLPPRRVPVAAGALVVAFCLPVFLLAGWRVQGWALGAVLWAASEALGLLFDRVGIHEPTLRGSGVVAFGMMTRGIVVVLVAIAVAVSDPTLAVAAALVYALAYTLELAFSLVLYFGGRPVR